MREGFDTLGGCTTGKVGRGLETAAALALNMNGVERLEKGRISNIYPTKPNLKRLQKKSQKKGKQHNKSNTYIVYGRFYVGNLYG